MEEVELQHWMRMACCRTIALGQQALQALVTSHSQKAAGQQSPLQVSRSYSLQVDPLMTPRGPDYVCGWFLL